MDIKIVYPDTTAAEFVDAVDDLNRDIEAHNSLSFLPRFIAMVFGITMFLVTLVFIWVSWRLAVFLITGRDKTTIVMGLVLMALMVPSALALQKKVSPLLKAMLLKALNLKDYEEKFTLHEYADRDDGRKRLADDLKFYNLCDELRAHKITDATITYDGIQCEVDISYNDVKTGTDVVRRVMLPLRIVAGGGNVVVDFERRCVIYPENLEHEEKI